MALQYVIIQNLPRNELDYKKYLANSNTEQELKIKEVTRVHCRKL